MQTEIIIALCALLLSIFFSGMEIAFTASNKLRLEIEKKQSKSYNYIASLFLRSPGQYLSTILVGNNIALVIYSIFLSRLYVQLTGNTNYALETLISTLIIIFVAEFIPKAIVKANPNLYLKTFAAPVYGFYVLFYPLARFTSWLSIRLLRLLGLRVDRGPEIAVFDKVDLASLVEETSGQNPSQEQESNRYRLFQNALDFSEQRVRDCMVPRTDMEAVDADISMEELRQAFISSGYSRLPVYRGNVDNVVGYVNLKSLFHRPERMEQILQQTLYVPETLSQQKLLQRLTQEHKSMAIVIDEFGSTAGMVTLEDLLEEIFGEIEDEHDTDDWVEKRVNGNEYVFSGRLQIDHLNQSYPSLKIPESERYDTLAGYVLYLSESIPEAGDVVEDQHLSLRILRVANSKVELIRLTKKG